MSSYVFTQMRKEGFFMSVNKITKDNFDSEVIKSSKTVLLDFYADWCGPCRMVGPLVEEIAEEKADIVVGKINIDEQPELAADFDVMSIPTLVVVKNGKVTNSAVGARSKDGILELLN